MALLYSVPLCAMHPNLSSEEGGESEIQYWGEFWENDVVYNLCLTFMMTGQQSGGPGNLALLWSSCLLPDCRGNQGERRQQLKSLPSSQFNYRYLSQNQMYSLNKQCKSLFYCLHKFSCVNIVNFLFENISIWWSKIKLGEQWLKNWQTPGMFLVVKISFHV